MESNIHYPTDSSLLVDVRVLGRTLRRAGRAISEASSEVGEDAKALFRNRLRSARNAAREIGRATRRGVSDTAARCRRAYRGLVQTTQASIRQAQAVVNTLQGVTTYGAHRVWAQGLAGRS